jgi:hypothetical protein
MNINTLGYSTKNKSEHIALLRDKLVQAKKLGDKTAVFEASQALKEAQAIPAVDFRHKAVKAKRFAAVGF